MESLSERDHLGDQSSLMIYWMKELLEQSNKQERNDSPVKLSPPKNAQPWMIQLALKM